MTSKSKSKKEESVEIPLAAGAVKVQTDDGSFVEVPGEVMLAVQSGRGMLVGMLINRIAKGHQLPAEQVQGVLVILRSLIDSVDHSMRLEQEREELREELAEQEGRLQEAERVATIARKRRDDILAQIFLGKVDEQ